VSDKGIVSKIVGLLASDAADRQVAAAVVLGELGVRESEVVDGLVRLLDHQVVLLQRHAVEALGRIGAKRALPALIACLTGKPEEIRKAAVEAVVAYGEDAVPVLKERLAAASPHEKRPFEELLARLGGKDALGALLGGIPAEDFEGARNAVLPLRARLKEADRRERRRTLEQVTKFLASKAAAASPAARVAALKILGFTEDEAGTKDLLAFAEDKREHEAVRQEALVALRLVTPTPMPAKVADALVALGEKSALPVARVALLSLMGAALGPAHEKRLGKLAGHPEAERGLLAIDVLGQQGGDAAAGALAEVLATTDERVRAEAAANVIAKRPDAGPTLAEALVASKDPDRVEVLGRLIRPHLTKLDTKDGKRLIKEALGRLADEDPSAEALLQVARGFDAETVNGELRELREHLRKSKKFPRALQIARLIGRSRVATPDDGYALVSLELGHGLRDEALGVARQLLERNFDLAEAMRKDRTLTDQHRYDVGFQLIERGHPVGEELLSAVSEAAGRNKLGQMARAKLKSSGFAD
jgi:HEAT repeat protein